MGRGDTLVGCGLHFPCKGGQHSLHRAKRTVWKTVNEAITETINLIHELRQSDTFSVSVKPKPPTSKTKVISLRDINMQKYEAWLNNYVRNQSDLKTKSAALAARKNIIKKRYQD